jgi:hypothetical protein
MNTRMILLSLIIGMFASCNTISVNKLTPSLRISENNRFLQTDKGDPFFWLGDTGWMLFTKLTREEAEKYLEDRRNKGFNVIQVMVLQNIRNEVNAYGDTALVSSDISRPLTTPGNSFNDSAQYDFWDHADYIVDLAGQKGIYMALVPVWGSNVRAGLVSGEQAVKYAKWIASRYKEKSNIIWLNGGDVRGTDSTAIWNIIGNGISQNTDNQLITYHPFGRTQSSAWFHNESWLDFNMFQSGHRRYDQDTTGLAYGEDNWKYAEADYNKLPVRPTLDGEPSYESIPQGLHDPTQPYWTDDDIRRYAYWSVFAGGCGFTYGHNAVMQFHKPGDRNPAYGVKEIWDEALNAPAASQMQYLKKLILSRPYFERVPANELLGKEQGLKYNYIAITKGDNYIFAYTCNGSIISLNLKTLNWSDYKASWFNPRDGSINDINTIQSGTAVEFDPPGDIISGNDWVLILDKNI